MIERDFAASAQRAAAVLLALVLLFVAGWWVLRRPAHPDTMPGVTRAALRGDPGASPVPPRAPAAARTGPDRPAAAVTARIWVLYRAAQGGDPSAMWQLSEIAHDCRVMGLPGRSWHVGSEQMALTLSRHQSAAVAGLYRQAAARLHAQCTAYAATGDGLQGRAAYWRDRAAEAGDLSARIAQRLYARDRNEAALGPLLDEVIASGRGAPLYEIGPLLMGHALTDTPIAGYEQVRFTEYDQYALTEIACERGLDCRPGSPVMDRLCLVGLECRPGETLGDLVHRYAMAAGDHQALDQARARMRLLLEGTPPP